MKKMYFHGHVSEDDWKRESRNADFAQNKLVGYQGSGVSTVIRHDSHKHCQNFATTTDVVYRHLPRPLCGPPQRYYRRSAHIYYPQPDLMECFGNITEWGLRAHLSALWRCARESDYANTSHEVAYTAPRPDQYLPPAERKARNSCANRLHQSGCRSAERKGFANILDT